MAATSGTFKLGRRFPQTFRVAGSTRAGVYHPVRTNGRLLSTAALKKSGSQYENYDSTSQTYDSWRRPIGMGTYTKTLKRVAKTLGRDITELTVLEAGCGTANYTRTVAPLVGQAFGLEYSEGMLEKARAKCQSLDNVELMQGNICSMDQIADGSMDVAMVNQVLHHLYSDTAEFAPTKEALSELVRVVKPGGAVIIQTQTPAQHRIGFWWADLVPNAASKLAKRFPPLEMLEHVLCNDLGMVDFKTKIPAKPLIRTERYLDITGPFNEQFRAADSTWALVTDSEMNDGLKRLQSIIDDGRGEEYMADRETMRDLVGQTTTVVAFKC